MENKSQDSFSFEEKVVADEVAEDILKVETEKEDKKYFVLLVLFLLGLIFLVSSISFAVFDNYFNGSSLNSIKVGIDFGVDEDKQKDDDNKKEEDTSYDVSKNSLSDDKGNTAIDLNDASVNNSDNTGSNEEKPSIDVGSILFTFNEKSNYISMQNVLPMADEVGKNLTGDKQYFDFSVSATFNKDSKGILVYEISLVPISGNTIDSKDVRVYLTENQNSVSVMKKEVNSVAGLPDSSYRNGAKVLYRKVVNSSFIGNYVFRMWLDKDAKISEVSKTFGCKIVVDAYYK